MNRKAVITFKDSTELPHIWKDEKWDRIYHEENCFIIEKDNYIVGIYNMDCIRSITVNDD